MKTKHKHKQNLKTKVKTKKKTKYMKLNGSITMSAGNSSNGWTYNGYSAVNGPNYNVTTTPSAAAIIGHLRLGAYVDTEPTGGTGLIGPVTASGFVGSEQLPDIAAVQAFILSHPEIPWVLSSGNKVFRQILSSVGPLPSEQLDSEGNPVFFYFSVSCDYENSISATITIG